MLLLDTKALWDDIIYNAVTQTLTWEAACPIQVNISLCQLMKTNDQCVDLLNSSKTAQEKVSAEEDVCGQMGAFYAWASHSL